ncbi:MAG: O-antigen ligase family protein, partial [Anaerolineales bacterium]
IAPLDWAVLAFVGASLMATLFANNRGVAWTEFRTMVAEPVVVYALFRLLPIRTRDVWRVVDFWMLAGAAVAIIGLVQYFNGVNLITAEGGVARLRSVYGSPNNVGLYLGRTLPIAVAVALMGTGRRRRIVYAAAALAMGAALVLSFSRGALLLGMPAALAVILLFWQRRRAAYALIGLAGAGLLALIPLSRNPRFAELGNLSTGPTFFRLNLWRSTLSMIRDHPLVGVGLDNFLYEYRGRYILPSAWQDPSLSHAHNWVLDYAARLGLPGLAVAVWLLGVLGRNLWQTARRAANPNRRALAVGLLASLVDFLAHGMVDASYWFIDLAFVFMLTAGLAQWLTTALDSR